MKQKRSRSESTERVEILAVASNEKRTLRFLLAADIPHQKPTIIFLWTSLVKGEWPKGWGNPTPVESVAEAKRLVEKKFHVPESAWNPVPEVMPTAPRLAKFAREERRRIVHTLAHITHFGYVANRRVTIQRDGIAIRIEACYELFELYAKSSQSLTFTVSEFGDPIQAFGWINVDAPNSPNRFRCDAAEAEQLKEWLSSGFGSEFAHMKLLARERFDIFGGRVHFLCSADRPLHRASIFVAELCKHLPNAATFELRLQPGELVVDGLIFNEHKLPNNLEPLAELIPKWAVGDDRVRSRKIAKASKRAKTKLLEIVQPLFPAIKAYLDEFGDEQPDEAILVGNVAEAAAEVLAEFDPATSKRRIR